MCDNPLCSGHGRTPKQVLADIRHKIRLHGWTVIGILGSPSFAYTVGMTALELPELYVAIEGPGTADSLSYAQRLLNAVGALIVEDTRKAAHNEPLVVIDSGIQWNVLFEVRLNKRPLTKAYELYGTSFRVLEVTVVGRETTVS